MANERIIGRIMWNPLKRGEKIAVVDREPDLGPRVLGSVFAVQKGGERPQVPKGWSVLSIPQVKVQPKRKPTEPLRVSGATLFHHVLKPLPKRRAMTLNSFLREEAGRTIAWNRNNG